MTWNPARWLWGLIPILALTVAAVAIEQGEIERDLQQRAGEALAQDNLLWAATTFSGRDVTLSGTVEEGAETKAAVEALKSVWGVRSIKERVALADRIDGYFWAATLKKEEAVRLTGQVPTEAIRKAIIGVAKANFPKLDVQDKMRLAEGAPGRDTWLGGVSFALKQLAALKRGSIELKGTALSIVGEAEDDESYKAVKTALQTSLPQGIRLAADRVTPPVARPYVWSARLGPAGLVVGGHVPSEDLREQLFLGAKRAFPSLAIIDRMRTAEGAPEGFAEATSASLEQLAHIREGAAELRDDELTISGLVADEPTADAVRGVLKSRVPAGIKVTDTLRISPPPPMPPAAVAVDPPDAPDPARSSAAPEPPDTVRLAVPTPPEPGAIASEPESKAPAEVAALPEERRAEADRCQQLLHSVAMEGSIQFERSSAEIDPSSLPTLAKLAKVADVCPTARIVIEGHTDAEGSPDRNLVLSQRRAQSVVDYLASAGVSGARLSAVGYGAERPVAPNDTADNRAKNRRIEFTVTPE